MRCVCKPWNALLSESSFIKSHLHHSIHNNDEVLLFFNSGFSFESCSALTARPSSSPNLELTDFIKLPVNLQPKDRFIHSGVIGSVNGLICFHYGSFDNHVVHIWNPSLSAMSTLPPSSIPSGTSRKTHFRFGFDPKTDDYKVVKLTNLYERCEMAPQAEVYSMRKGSWKVISQKFPSYVTMIQDRDEVCVDGHDGHLHWLGCTDFRWLKEAIVAFDLGLETFRVISLPRSVLHDMGMNVVGVLAGKLCVMSRVRFYECDVWVMEEYGVAESWVRHHAFSQFSGDIYPFGFTLNGEFLFHVYNDRFALYDQIEEKSKIFDIMGGQIGKTKVVEYVDSLVWVTPAKHEMR
ncbi:hypothetical protein LXL04_022173 [Taraxacum kok-saghyz]